jgi:hypothetical protein
MPLYTCARSIAGLTFVYNRRRSREAYYHTFEGDITMTDTEKKLLDLVRESGDPEQAILIAISVVLDYLSQHGSSQAPSPDAPQEPA